MAKKKKLKSLTAFDIVIFIILTLWGLLLIYPFYNAILVSFTPLADYLAKPFRLYPGNVTLDAYRIVFNNKLIWSGYKNTLIVVFFGVLYSMFLTVTLAYGLSKKKFPGKGIIIKLIIFTMFFSGGLIPSYLLIKKLGMMNKLTSLIIPAGLSTYYMLLVRNFFLSLPDSLEESARIDGAGEFTILFKIILPLSMPVIATVTLFYTIDRWNDWFNSILYIRQADKRVLQAILRDILTIGSTKSVQNLPKQMLENANGQGVKMAALFISIAPIIFIYPFIQKYFMKGIMVGAVKE